MVSFGLLQIKLRCLEIMLNKRPEDVWTIADAKAKLSEVLKCADERPQYIGIKKPYVLVSAAQWEAMNKPVEPMGQWLVKNMADTGQLALPDRKEPAREIPFQPSS